MTAAQERYDRITQPIDSRAASYIQLLPAWFVPRMLEDNWSFGLLLTNNCVLVITQILAVHRDASGNLWLDVEMATDRAAVSLHNTWGRGLIASGMRLVGSPTVRLTASVNAAHVIWAFELADT